MSVPASGPAPRRSARVQKPRPTPDLSAELALAERIRAERGAGADAPLVIVGLDEVGRGALAGPVCIGACAVRIEGMSVLDTLPEGVRDSKALTPRRREALIEPISAAAHATAVGEASADEIDRHGIVAALALAAGRALDALGCEVDGAVVDGDVDILARRAGAARAIATSVLVGADARCATVAAASVVAKVHRDALMVRAAEESPHYDWASNKGYGSLKHRQAIAEHGPHRLHRLSWNLPAHTPRNAQPARGTDASGDVLWALEAQMNDEADTRGGQRP